MAQVPPGSAVWSQCGQHPDGDYSLCHRQASLTEQANARAAAGSSGGAAGNGILATMFGRSAAPAEATAAAAEPDADEAPKVALHLFLSTCYTLSHPFRRHANGLPGVLYVQCGVVQSS
jgi:hypothetical protein